MFVSIYFMTYKKILKQLRLCVIFILISVIIYLVNVRYKYGYYNAELIMNVSRIVGKDLIRFSHKSPQVINKEMPVSHGPHGNNVDTKYILLWTKDTATPFSYFGKGQNIFIRKNCKWTNCYVTNDRNYLGYYTEFDVIAFNGPQLSDLLDIHDIPRKRSIRQKYVFANIEAANNYPLNPAWNGFFNWTWTYNLKSDALWGYLAVRNATGHVVGPSLDARWIKSIDMDPIDSKLKESLKSKTIAAAWFSSNCFTVSNREEFVKMIKEEMQKLNLQLDIYGSCGRHHCPKEIMDRCLNILQKRYYFYFAFENALNEDYVTEKIVYALQHNTVPVVYGGANYSRFMPDGMYLDAIELGPKGLANKMHYLINNPSEYHKMLRWKKYYSFHFRHESPDTDDYCNFCSLINNDKLVYRVVKTSVTWRPGGKVPEILMIANFAQRKHSFIFKSNINCIHRLLKNCLPQSGIEPTKIRKNNTL